MWNSVTSSPAGEISEYRFDTHSYQLPIWLDPEGRECDEPREISLSFVQLLDSFNILQV